jgi:peptidoglycan hydrolase CwlO-like protein
MVTNIITLLGAILGGGIVFKTVTDRISMTKQEQYQALVMLVEQLQKNIAANDNKLGALDKKCMELEKEVDNWRRLYYEEMEAKNKLIDEVRRLTNELKKFNKQNN